MEGSYGFLPGSGVWRSLRDGDFEEEEVWAVLKDRTDSFSNLGKSIEPPAISVSRHLPSAARMIPRVGSSSNSPNHEGKVAQQSAPVNIPDWSKIYGKNARRTSKGAATLSIDADGKDYSDDEAVNYSDEGEDEDDDDEFDCKLPPHEFISRKLARSQISSFSVFEGVGRTLKGRDLSKVRNAVLTRTGFLESL